MREIGNCNAKSTEFRRMIVDVVKKESNPNMRTLNEIARQLLKRQGKNVNDFREKSRMLGSLSYHINKLIAEGRIEKKEDRNANIYSLKKEAGKNVSRTGDEYIDATQG